MRTENNAVEKERDARGEGRKRRRRKMERGEGKGEVVTLEAQRLRNAPVGLISHTKEERR